MFDRKIKSTKKTVPVKLLDTEEMLYGSTSSYMERKTMDVILIRCRNSSLFVVKIWNVRGCLTCDVTVVFLSLKVCIERGWERKTSY